MDVSAVQSAWAGQVVDGKFTLLQWLGGSGDSGVFLTELQGDPAKKAAIKLMPANACLVGATSAGLSHPHLMRVFASGHCEIDGISLAYVVMEFADEILAEILPLRPLTPDEVIEMLAAIVDALAYIHRQGLVHGHLKPSNILVVSDQLKLSADSLQPASNAASAMHALSVYDAPERTNGGVSPASDMWSLGITIVEVLTQRTPEWDHTANNDPQIPDSMPQPFAEIASFCLRVDPARRGTLSDVRKRLGLAVVQSLPEFAPKAIEAPKQKAAFRVRPSVLTVALLVTIAVIALLWSRSHEPQPQVEPSAQTAPEQQQPIVAPQPPAPKPPPAVPAGSVAASGGSVAQRVMPEVLQSASQSIQGRVSVSIRAMVDSSGNVSDARFESAGRSRYFARAAMDAVRQWKFTPPEANGRPVASTWTIQFVFTRGNTDATAEQTTH